MNQAWRRSGGFTLIELSIVVMIMILGLGVIAVNISAGNHASRLKSVARDLSSALRYARGQALVLRKPVSVDINLDENSYHISSRDKTYHFSSKIDVTLEIAENELKDKTGSLRFYPDGSSSGGRIKLEWGNLLEQLDVNWLTGKVDISHEAQ